MQEVESYPKTYIAHDKLDGHIIGRYTDINELIEEVNNYCLSHRGYGLGKLFQGHMKSDSVVVEKYRYGPVDYRIPDPKPAYWYAPYNNLIKEYVHVPGIYVTDELGDIVKDIWKLQARKPYKSSWKLRRMRRERVEKTLKRYKNNVNKIKAVYGYHEGFSQWSDEIEYMPDMSTYHRSIRTHSAAKKLSGFIKEEGEPEPRGRQLNLPDSWDDIGCCVWHQTKSWKHNSKRKKQWKHRSNE